METDVNIAVAGAPVRGSAFALERAQSMLLSQFADSGYARIEPPILQDATTFLDLGGEDIRARLYLTSDGSGAELCLRPEYTIPACRAYLQSAVAGQPASYSYCGPVFRFRPDGSGEFVQAGLESFGRPDIAAADAEILTLTLEASGAAGAPHLRVAMGDAGLVTGFLDAIELPPLWQRRLKRGLEKGRALEVILDGAPNSAGDRSGLLAALAGVDDKDARALVEDLLSIAGIATVGGRSIGEIAERFLAQVAKQSTSGFGGERRQLLERFMKIASDPDHASAAMRALVRDAKLDLNQNLDLFDERTGFIAASGIDVETIAFRTAFGRNLDYYTGFVFEARSADSEIGETLVGGGRYDRLAQALGSPGPIPAVGAAIWVERLVGAGAQS